MGSATTNDKIDKIAAGDFLINDSCVENKTYCTPIIHFCHGDVYYLDDLFRVLNLDLDWTNVSIGFGLVGLTSECC